MSDLISLPPACDRSAPHDTVASYVREMFSPERNEEDLGSGLLAVFDSRSPGKCFEEAGCATGYFDGEWMSEIGIAPFGIGTAYVLSWRDYTYYDEVMYSRAEFCGWMALAARKLVDQISTLRFSMHELQSRYYEPGPCADEIRRKLDGEVPWSFGPVGKRATPEDIEAWHAVHRPGYAALYV